MSEPARRTVSSGSGGEVGVWDAATGKPTFLHKNAHPTGFTHLAFASNGGIVRVSDAAAG